MPEENERAVGLNKRLTGSGSVIVKNLRRIIREIEGHSGGPFNGLQSALPPADNTTVDGEVLTTKPLPDLTRYTEGQIDGPELEIEKPPLPKNILNADALPLPDYARSQNIEVKEVLKPSSEEDTPAKIINPEGEPLPVFMAKLVEKREREKSKAS